MNRWIELGRESLQDPNLPIRERDLMELFLRQMEQSYARLQATRVESSLTDEQLGEIITLPTQAKDALKRNHAFFIIRPESLNQLLAIHGEHGEFFGFVNPSEHLRALAPRQAFEAAIPVNSKGLAEAIARSNNLPLVDRDLMNREYATRLVLPGIKSITGTASIYSQADIQHQRDGRGKLIVGFYAGTGDETVAPRVADVGRIFAGHRLLVHDWYRGYGDDYVRALPVVVPAQLEI